MYTGIYFSILLSCMYAAGTFHNLFFFVFSYKRKVTESVEEGLTIPDCRLYISSFPNSQKIFLSIPVSRKEKGYNYDFPEIAWISIKNKMDTRVDPKFGPCPPIVLYYYYFIEKAR